ncbi:cell adhesion molecule CEACAM2-like [Mytilus galloprovincialis]|uniref:cell adhesion molecule CEACAM2-like n=1 Tax=Mytilus galloprovincialis TaxID=29158 RepID=UPI003F7CAEDD
MHFIGVPNVSIPNSNYSRGHGYYLELECNIESTPNHTSVYWQKLSNGTITNITSTSPGFYGSRISLPSLTINPVSQDDAGQYTCFAVNLVGIGKSQPTTLTVLGDIPYIHLEPGPFNASHGSNITLKCNITSVPTHFNVYWESVSNGVTTTWHQGETYGQSVALLDLDNASSSDSGQYICFAENVLGTGKSKPVNVTIYGDQDHPKVNIQSNQYVVKYGSPLTIASSVQTTEFNPVSDVYWQFNNNGVITKISEETDGINGSTIKIPSLTILNVTSSESGTYTFYAKNDIETGHSRPIHVFIIGGVPKVSVSKSNYTAGYGKSVTMFCNITSDPIVTNVYWEKEFNDTTIVINNVTTGIQGISVDVPSMTIVTTTTSDIGNYRCIATNDVGTGCSETTRLEVIGGEIKAEVTSEDDSDDQDDEDDNSS